ncbi:signal peptide peptidase-like 4 [Phtheirospermum japonicum]|uniref:Signal peptide peptidase-like 4 n=1 Tax=Phtheirospermum japonicum TaxID=374723 RepID=A0A830BVN3_9LAMI|nr:signal peptide peptidase-like 4 [Phtheirospermum japonicum]
MMKLKNRALYCSFCAVAVLFCSSVVFAGDIVHQDDVAPKRPGCENNFVLVKVPVWQDGKEIMEFVGVGARFGPTLESKEKRASQTKVALADPPDCCSKPRNKLAGEVILVHRGNCSFVSKANVAEAAGASALLIINNAKELFKMVCESNETDVNIGIPVVMLPQDAGVTLRQSMMNNSHGNVSIQMYSPQRPEVDVAEVFLWLMAVDQNKETCNSSGIVDINTKSAIFFVVIASCFLIMLYKLMSYVFIEILVVVFCIGGTEGLQTCLVALLSCFRWFDHAADSYVKLPIVGAVSYLTLAVSPFCVVFAVLWAVFRRISLAWIGQDILGIALIITVLQIVRVPNLKV